LEHIEGEESRDDSRLLLPRAKLARRPLFANAPLRDDNFRWRSVGQVLKAAAAVYRLYGVPQNLQVEHPDCAHDFPLEVREAAYRFLDQHLR
jgi:hypothetical protein